MVPVITRLLKATKLTRRLPLSFILPVPCFPIMSSQHSFESPTFALRSPLLQQDRAWEPYPELLGVANMKMSLSSSVASLVGAYTCINDILTNFEKNLAIITLSLTGFQSRNVFSTSLVIIIATPSQCCVSSLPEKIIDSPVLNLVFPNPVHLTSLIPSAPIQ